jgi:hypothetical protein
MYSQQQNRQGELMDGVPDIALKSNKISAARQQVVIRSGF